MALRPLTAVVGSEELLVARAVAGVVAEARLADPGAELVELPVAELAAGRLAELVSPSLFGGTKVVLIPDLGDGGKAAAAVLAGYAKQPAPDTAIVGVLTGRARAAVDLLRAAGAAVLDCPAPRWPSDREAFVVAEVRAAGGRIEPDAARGLLAAVGNNLRELANACAQLVADSGGRIDETVVARYHRGRAESNSYVIADRAVEGDAAGAFELLRWALSLGASSAGLTAALEANLRTIALVAAAGGRATAQVAKELNLPEWKVRKAQGWARGWRPGPLADALIAVAEADAAVKGAVADPGYAAERLVLLVARARGAG